MKKKSDHNLTHEELWIIMRTCAAPEVAKAIREADECGHEQCKHFTRADGDGK